MTAEAQAEDNFGLGRLQLRAYGYAKETNELFHTRWLGTMLKDGWRYGEVTNIETKTHKSLLPYADLPASHKFKDSIFYAIVCSYTSRAILLTNDVEQYGQLVQAHQRPGYTNVSDLAGTAAAFIAGSVAPLKRTLHSFEI